MLRIWFEKIENYSDWHAPYMQITGLHCTSSTKQHWLHGFSRSLTKYVRIQMKYFGLERIKRKTRGKNVSSNETKQKEKKKLTEAVSIEHIKIISTDYLVSAHCCCCWSLCILSSADFDEYLSRLIPYAYRCSAWSHAYT